MELGTLLNETLWPDLALLIGRIFIGGCFIVHGLGKLGLVGTGNMEGFVAWLEELKVPMANVTWIDLPNAPAGSYEITVGELKQFNCVLEKNKKYWIAPAPVMDHSIGAIQQGFVWLWTSQNAVDTY